MDFIPGMTVVWILMGLLVDMPNGVPAKVEPAIYKSEADCKAAAEATHTPYYRMWECRVAYDLRDWK